MSRAVLRVMEFPKKSLGHTVPLSSPVLPSPRLPFPVLAYTDPDIRTNQLARLARHTVRSVQTLLFQDPTSVKCEFYAYSRYRVK